jgi:hypothetical protein
VSLSVFSRIYRTARSSLRPTTDLESGAMILGLVGMTLALGVTVAQATLAPTMPAPAELRLATAGPAADGTLCPDGWASGHAAALDLTEAQVSAWYLRESLDLSDTEVIAGIGIASAGMATAAPRAAARTRHQILLCIAESRRLTTPTEARVAAAPRGA